MLRLGRVASDRKSDNISYVIGSTMSKMDSGPHEDPIGNQCDDARARKQFRAEHDCRPMGEKCEDNLEWWR